jgi:hypothetical protein
METKLNILQRLAAVQGELDYIQKDKPKGMTYSIVSHDKVTAAVRPLMVKYGVLYYPSGMRATQDGNRTEVQMTVTFVNVDDKTDYLDVATIGYGIDTQDKGPGKAMSYCVKYALLKTLGLETGDDPDQDQDVKHEADKPKASKATSREDFDRLVKEIRNMTSLAALVAWNKENAAATNSMPRDWFDDLKVEYLDKQSELKKALAA